MTQALRLDDVYITPEQYLATERLSDVKHEYVAGRIYAMAGTTAGHDRIANNVGAELRQQLRGRRCEVFSSNLRVRIRQPGQAEFNYYPDAIVDCSALSHGAIYAEEPAVIFEVLSSDTERVDTGEKLGYCRTLPSLGAYVMISQRLTAVTIYRRTGEAWAIEFLGHLDAVLELPEIECRLPLTAIYERIFSAPPGS